MGKLVRSLRLQCGARTRPSASAWAVHWPHGSRGVPSPPTRYYYNKDTKESKWTMPEELKRAKGLATSASAASVSDAGEPAGTGSRWQPLLFGNDT